MEDLKTSVVPELELIESRIVGPIKEFQGILKAIRKSITKREHKVNMSVNQAVLSAHAAFRSLLTMIVSTTP